MLPVKHTIEIKSSDLQFIASLFVVKWRTTSTKRKKSTLLHQIRSKKEIVMFTTQQNE